MENIIVLLIMLALGYFFGHRAEKAHYASIMKREEELQRPLLVLTKRLPQNTPPVETRLTSGNVVISVDYFKRFLATLRNLVGGRVTSYESLLDRARREAILRMREEAAGMGAYYVFNVKIETSSISKGEGKTVGSVEVLAYGTAVIPIRADAA